MAMKKGSSHRADLTQRIPPRDEKTTLCLIRDLDQCTLSVVISESNFQSLDGGI